MTTDNNVDVNVQALGDATLEVERKDSIVAITIGISGDALIDDR